MGAKIKVIIKRPDEKIGHVTNISPTLENLQRTVDGYVEDVILMRGSGDKEGHNVIMIVNEEGKIKGLDKNIIMGTWAAFDVIRGTLIVAQAGPDGDLEDLDLLSFDAWKDVLKHWGNI